MKFLLFQTRSVLFGNFYIVSHYCKTHFFHKALCDFYKNSLCKLLTCTKKKDIEMFKNKTEFFQKQMFFVLFGSYICSRGILLSRR